MAIEQLRVARDDATLDLAGQQVAITHLGKILWPSMGDLPGYTRRDFILYLLCMAPYLLAHLRDRPLTLIRQPEGVMGRRFVHFHYEQPLPTFVETIDIYSENAKKPEQYLMCNNAPTLIWLAHVGCLEFHAWHSRVRAGGDAGAAGSDYSGSSKALHDSALNRPDYLVCDLDPYIYSGQEATAAQPELNRPAFERCKEVAFSLKALLDSMGLVSVVKTSGMTGLHVLVPIARTITYDEARAVTTTLARHLMARNPELITMEAQVAKRAGKVFFDAGMNARVKTLSVPYSSRGVCGAPVSMPLRWSQLKTIQPLDFTMNNVPASARAGDLWANMPKQDLKRILGARV